MNTKLMAGLKRWNAVRNSSIPPQKKLSRDAVISLIIHWCFQFGASMSGVFLNLYLWRLTHSLWINGMYNIIVFAVTPIAFAVGGKIAKKKDRLVTFRLGIIFIALFYLLVVIAQKRVVDYYVVFALFNGIAASFYWTGYLTLMYDVSTDENRIRYLAINMITFTSAGLLGPALAGFIISRNEGLTGYVITFSLAFIMFSITTFISFRLKTDKSHHKAYYLKFMGLLMRKNHTFLRSLYAFFVFGLLQGLMLFLPAILLYQVLPKEDMVGYLGVFYSSLGIASSMLISRFAKEHLVKIYVVLATVGFTIGSLLLLWKMNLATVIGFMILYSAFQPVQGNSMTSYYYRLIGRLPLKGQLRIESVVIRELFVNAGRIVAIFFLITMADNMEGIWLPLIILAASLLQFTIPLLLKTEK